MLSHSNKLPITLNEKMIIGSNAFICGMGTSSLLVEGLWYLGTMGVELSGAAALGALCGVGMGMIVLTLPIAYSFYKQAISEAESANKTIKHSLRIMQHNQKKLFVELLKQRNCCHSEKDFRENETNLEKCFATVSIPTNKNKLKSTGWGAIAGLTVGGAALSTSWAFGALFMSGALCAAIPVVGWCVLGLASLALGIMFGVGMGMCKYKNYQRQSLIKNIKNQNSSLKKVIRQVQEKNVNDAVELHNHNETLIPKKIAYSAKESSPLRKFSLVASPKLKPTKSMECLLEKNQFVISPVP